METPEVYNEYLEKEENPQPFWMLYAEGQNTPAYKHPSIESAIAEKQRLERELGVDVHILELTSQNNVELISSLRKELLELRITHDRERREIADASYQLKVNAEVAAALLAGIEYTRMSTDALANYVHNFKHVISSIQNYAEVVNQDTEEDLLF